MTAGKEHQVDWDPRSEAVLKDQIGTYDRMRARCPLARSPHGYVTLFRHADVLRAALDHVTYSNAVSRFPSVPNGMDPPEHTAFREIMEPFFTPERMREFEPVCRQVSRQLIDGLPHGSVEFMGDFARIFAVQIQCAFMGWPSSLHEPLLAWTRRNHEATLRRDEAAMMAVALEFDGYIRDQLAARRQPGVQAAEDTTSRLMRARVAGRPLSDDELVSILRNWTVGELSTISASIGILAHYLATHPHIQDRLRSTPADVAAANDEILRIHPPLIMNRRVTTTAVTVDGRRIEAGERVALLWASANRDERVFGDPDEFRMDRDPELNLLYGAGIHVCPGAPLARLELIAVVQDLLASTRHIALIDDEPPTKAFFPASGFASLPLHLEKTG